MTLSDSWIPQWSVPGHAWAGNLIRLDYNRPWAINCRQGSAVAFMTSMKTCFNERYKTGIGWCWEGETYLIYGKWMIERSLTDSISALLSAIYSELSMVMSSGPGYWLLATISMLSFYHAPRWLKYPDLCILLTISLSPKNLKLNTFIIPVHYITSFITPIMIPT